MMDQELFGEKRMMKALKESLREAGEYGNTGKLDLQLFLRLMRSRIDEFAGDTPQFDDLTMMCVEYRGTDTTAQNI